MRPWVLLLTIVLASCGSLRAAIPTGGVVGDDRISLIYDPANGNVKLDAAGKQLTAIELFSSNGYFDYETEPCPPLAWCDSRNRFFLLTIGGNTFGDRDFGVILPPGLEENVLAGDLRVNGALAPMGGLETVDLIYVPEPACATWLALGLCATALRRFRRVE